MLGVIPKVKKLDSVSKSHIVAANSDRHVTENFRSILSYLKINELSKNGSVFLITSTVPGEGKSFVSSNLALSFAANGEKVLLLDADLRLPNIAKSLQLDNESGVLDFISSENDSFEDFIIPEVYPNLDVLSSGGKSKNPTAVLGDPKFESMILQVRDSYDKIIIDSPPLAAVSDALNVVPLIDSVIYIVRYDTVKKNLISSCVRKLWESKTPVVGAIMNNVALGLSSYYYSHYTDKKYSDYYLQDDFLTAEVDSNQTTDELDSDLDDTIEQKVDS